jgi:hypothetical protein
VREGRLINLVSLSLYSARYAWFSIVQPSVSRLQILKLFTPAVNCWASIIRPLCGLIDLLLVQSQIG